MTHSSEAAACGSWKAFVHFKQDAGDIAVNCLSSFMNTYTLDNSFFETILM